MEGAEPSAPVATRGPIDRVCPRFESRHGVLVRLQQRVIVPDFAGIGLLRTLVVDVRLGRITLVVQPVHPGAEQRSSLRQPASGT
eukprot:COSAG02_NODE_586_length_19960_cov_13.442118_18_plen_85_part_00